MIATEARAWAPGKLILAGEHAVVYGHPAIAAAVSLGTTVRLVRRAGPSAVETCTAQSRQGAEAVADDPRLLPALMAVLPLEGVGVHIHTDLPVGRGMGSSAALAVALVRALARLEGRQASAAECHERGFLIERVFHGAPSGLDHTVSSLGGAILYRRLPQGIEHHALALPDLSLVVLDTGVQGNTAALVAQVAAQRPGVDPVLAEIGALALEVQAALCGPDPAMAAPLAGPLLTYNHDLLRGLGVSTPALDHAVELAITHGAAGAKLAGAGGGGVVLALMDGPAEPLIAAAHAAGFHAFPARIAPPEHP